MFIKNYAEPKSSNATEARKFSVSFGAIHNNILSRGIGPSSNTSVYNPFYIFVLIYKQKYIKNNKIVHIKYICNQLYLQTCRKKIKLKIGIYNSSKIFYLVHFM
ncbi:hypothetical protein EDEG_03279 [Edhazardia aedis USNM 41457]|uniref:Uncharacterized protein n=1 Tax=Edhazardia aedis (strain USNM 41457) TaxID=1003232 RepID=J9DI33_EDHAE|nr:hypothetical protein EDEG_03279 [Edhazardia aedis USNM 41457]|eukprot:EJW02285.1 hypothetical protein EDEG_03279 [Edhazardia aedis USNM 41457]